MMKSAIDILVIPVPVLCAEYLGSFAEMRQEGNWEDPALRL
jgi:hypothetical protein